MSSKRVIGCVGFGVLAVAFSLSVVAVSDAAEPTPMVTTATATAMPSMVMASCAAGAANATIDLTSTTFGEVTSPDANYINAGCKRYVVDIKLPPNLNQYFVSQMVGESAMASGYTTQATCEAAQVTAYYYRKAAGQLAFSNAGGGTARGSWNANPGFAQTNCTMKLVTGATTRTNSPALGGDTWRVAVGAVEHSLSVKVKVSTRMTKDQ